MEKEEKRQDTMSATNSRKTYISFYLMASTLVVATAYIKSLGLEINPLAFQGVITFAVLGLGITEIHRLKHSYQVTPYFLIHNKGYIAKKIKRISLVSISDVDLQQTLWQKFLGYGDIHVHLFSEGSRVTIKNINSPKRFAEILEKNIEGNMSRGNR